MNLWLSERRAKMTRNLENGELEAWDHKFFDILYECAKTLEFILDVSSCVYSLP
jgi:hypothetical protein